VLGFRLMTAFATGYGGVVLPPFSRFYAGGEDTVRGFDIRTVTPLAYVPTEQTTQIFYLDPTRLDGVGNPTLQQLAVPVLLYSVTFPGGDAQAIGNVEYRIPLVGPVSMALFFDAGLNGALRRNQLQLDATGVADLQQKYPAASLSKELEIASGTNFKLRTSTGVEFVVQLPIVNAPFRLYWAYNLTRLNTTLDPPRGIYNPDQLPPLPPGVRENIVIPQLDLLTSGRRITLSEPSKTFRFTVSRTF
jgi:outer membrane protein insertion porin family